MTPVRWAQAQLQANTLFSPKSFVFAWDENEIVRFGMTYVDRTRGRARNREERALKAKRAALYVRVSSGEQNAGAQERTLRDYVQRRRWKVEQIYRDQGVSGAS